MSSIVTFEPDTALQWKFHGFNKTDQLDPKQKIVEQLQELIKNNPGVEEKDEWNGYQNATTLDLALCSSEAYKSYHSDLKQKTVRCQLDVGWRWLCSAENEENKYFGIVFVNVGSGNPRVMVAHRGTTMEWKVLLTDITGILENQLTAQINSACTFILTLVEAMKEIQEGGSYVQMSITGHSLGGWLAQISTFAAQYLEIQSKITTGQYFKRRADGTGFHPHCEVFDSPGVKQILQRLNREIVGGDDFLQKLDITVFIIVPNIINTINEHLGEQIVFFLDSSTKYWKKVEKLNPSTTSGFGKFLEMSKKVHLLENFIVELKNEKVSKKRLAISWPLVLVRNWSHNTFTAEPGFVSAIYKIASTPFRHFLLANADLLLGEIKDVFVKQTTSKFFQTVEFNHQRINLNAFSDQEADFIVDLFHWDKYNHYSSVLNNQGLIEVLEVFQGIVVKSREIIIPQHLHKETFISLVRKYVWTNGKNNNPLLPTPQRAFVNGKSTEI